MLIVRKITPCMGTSLIVKLLMTFMIQTFVWGIICLLTLLVIRKITPIPIVMEAWKGKNIRKCFLSVPVIHDPSNLPHVSSSIPIHTSLLSTDHPRILRPPNNRQAQGHYVTDEQYIHIPANMITHCLRNNYIKLLIHYTLKTLLRRFPCGCNLNIVICNFIVA